MNALLKLLGADSEDKGIEIVTAFSDLMAELKALTGAPSAESGAILTAVKSAVDLGKTLGSDKAALETEVATLKGDQAKVLAAVGETTVDAALGSIATAKAARDELLPAANASIAAYKKTEEDAQKAAEVTEADALLAKLESENKISPTQKGTLWPTLSLESKRSFAATAPVIELTKDQGVQESGTASGTVTSSGKAYADMTFSERAALKRENRVLYESLRAAHEASESQT